MKKTILLLLLSLSLTPVSFAKNSSKPVLHFNKTGKFKILQFTDIHFQYNSFRSDSALLMIKAAVEKEKPNLVVLTGDVVCSKDTRQAWLALAKPLIAAKVPWAVTLGNHDIEYELSGKEIMETISGLPYKLTVYGPRNISGNGNYILKVQSSNSSETRAVLYFFDSHSGIKPKSDWGSYDWVKSDQIEWYRNQSQKLTKKNDGKPFPALAFFHIPLPEYNEVWGKETTVGVKGESVCSPDINSGLYNAFLESADVMGMFVGHDHNNNYIGCLRNICMAYGQASGRQCYGDIGRGYRVIELTENERKFDTWVHIRYICDRDKDIWEPTNDNGQRYVATYPGSFSKKE